MGSVYKRSYWVEKGGKRVKRFCKKYTVEYTLPDGRIRRVPGHTDKSASEQLRARLEREAARGEEGLIDRYAEHKRRKLSEHVAEYIADLGASGRDGKYVENCEYRLTKLAAACGWNFLPDISADSFARWRETATTIGPTTKNQYLETARTFCKWCVRRKRIGANPLSELDKVDPTADIRRARRAYTEAEIARLLAASGHHRPVYLFILGTGLRRQEVEDLRWGDLHLNSPSPFMTLRAEATKARRADCLPLRADLADDLRRMRGGAGDGAKVFPGGVPTVAEHKTYLAAAGIAWEDQDGRRADIHALRHTFGTMLSKSGVAPRVAMELMRHKSLDQTMKVYTDPKLFDLAGAVGKLPAIWGAAKGGEKQPAMSAATGTNGVTPLVGRLVGTGFRIGHPAASVGTTVAGWPNEKSPVNRGKIQLVTTPVSEGQSNQKAPRVGLESTRNLRNSPGNLRVSDSTGGQTGGTHSETASAGGAWTIGDEILAAVVAAWPRLPDHTRQTIGAMVKALG
jgi:integrase